MFSTTLTSGLNTGREDMLENTAELRAFTSIDMGKISQDRVQQLEDALLENIQEKEREVDECETKVHEQTDLLN